jgi:hypothetical protein
MKTECTRRLASAPSRTSLTRELAHYVDWFNCDRPHTRLAGATPDEAYFGLQRAAEQPRHEPRSRYPREAACAAPQAPVKGTPGVKIEVRVGFRAGRAHLPVISVTRVA